MSENHYISLETCKSIRSIMAVLIMFHHLARVVTYGTIPNAILIKIGISVTTIFFFYSSYGLMMGLKNKPNYLKGFLQNRISSVLIPFIIASFVYCVFLIVDGRGSYIISKVPQITKGKTLLPNSWFIISILVLYIIFFLSFRWVKDISIGLIICTVIVSVYTILLCSLDFDAFWYSNNFVFIFGLFYARYFEKCDGFLKNKPVIKAAFFILAFAALTVMDKLMPNEYAVLVLKNLRSICACIIILYGSMIMKAQSSVLLFLGGISLEFYMYHGILIEVFKPLSDRIWLFTMAVAMGTVVVAYFFKIMDSRIISKIRS